MMYSATPVSTSSVMPRAGPPGSAASMSLASSAEIRSADTIFSRGASSVMAAASSGVTEKPSCAANLAALSMRSGSSLSDSAGLPGVLSRRPAKSRSPPNKSTNS